MQNIHLVPEIVINIADKFKQTKNQNELFNLQLRLEAIKEYVETTLKGKETDKYGSLFKKK